MAKSCQLGSMGKVLLYRGFREVGKMAKIYIYIYIYTMLLYIVYIS
ncbi:hypothetical protein [Wolbachia endosymbiont wVitB of Nasonia vitripennis phage WOVitB]|nr:hypothetical protein [Wolbachia endosymbiont wVitB of Nasonia vitripennis phage WOVitB]